MRRSSSGNISKIDCKYLMPEFYCLPENQFWENGLYSEKSKEYFHKLAERDARHVALKGSNYLPFNINTLN